MKQLESNRSECKIDAIDTHQGRDVLHILICYLDLYFNYWPFNHLFNSHHNVHTTHTHPFDACDKQLDGARLQL